MLAVDYKDPIDYKIEADDNIKEIIAHGYYQPAETKITGKIVKFVNNKYGFVYDEPQVAGLYVINYYTVADRITSFDSIDKLLSEIKYDYGDFTIVD